MVTLVGLDSFTYPALVFLKKFIDDRVRAISLAMGLTPIIWTRTPTAGQFDTNGKMCRSCPEVRQTDNFLILDWQVAGGMVTGAQSFATFEAILGNASLISTGYVIPCSLSGS